MPTSPAFIRIKAQTLQIVAAIPASRVSTYRAIGAHLDVMPRHVAYILTMLEPVEKLEFPWFRVVGDDGALGTLKRNADGRTQAELLADEGLVVSNNSVAISMGHALIEVQALNSGVDQQTRPVDVAKPARRTKIIRN
jgi:methylated-DNA-protein-cysteine methyltransferase related protein